MARKGKLIPWNGESRTVLEWSRLLGVPTSTIESRARRGKPLNQERERPKWKEMTRTPGVRATDHPLYGVWSDMRNRCRNPGHRYWADYGGRGISVCPEWNDSFWAFAEYMGPKPTPKHSIDRYPNNDGNYEPGNVRWASPQEQLSNKRTVGRYTWQGETMTVPEWAARVGLPYIVMWGKVHYYKGDMAKVMASVERTLNGSLKPNEKLTDEDVRAIRSAYDSGSKTSAALAREFGVSASHMHKIVNRQSRRDVA
jgi:hypothetical protein